jgi:iron complex outermembrane receptor protein
MKTGLPPRVVLAHAVALACTAGTALAQTNPAPSAPQRLEKIEITGSNIKRVDAEGPLPVTVITREEIDRSANSTVGDFVRALTVNTGGSGSDSDISNQNGSAGVSLRGLGQKSTLVLINGRRMANHAFARDLQDTFVDLNSIPKSAIQRIEVLKDGASAVYGSDAIAGVVNFILRKDYQAGAVQVGAGRSTEGGLGEQSFNISAGWGDPAKDKYNVFGVVDVYHREQLLLSEREWVGNGDFSRFPGGGNGFLSSSAGTWVSVAPQTAFSPTSLALQPAGVPGGVRRQAFLTCMGNGFRQTVVPFAPLVFSTGTVCSHTTTPFIVAYPEVSRIGVFSRGNWQTAGGGNAFAEFQLAHNKTEWISQPQTMTNVTQVFNPVTQASSIFNTLIPANNPANPFGAPYRLRYTFFDVGARTNDNTTNAYRLFAGMSGNMNRWDWEFGVGTSESKVEQTTGNQVDAQALTNAINNNTYNFLAPTPAQTAALRISTQRNSTSKLHFGDLKATTTLGALEGGDIGFAVGLDARRESIQDTPDPLVRAGRLLGTGSSITNGSRNVIAAYAEANLPLTKALEFQVAARMDRYSDFGSSSSPKVGFKWTPMSAVLFRGAWSKGFRAPTLTENTQTSSLTFATLTGSPGGVSVIFTGNPNLKPERSESATFGIVIEPMKSLSFGIDWFEIAQKDLVAANGIQFIAQNPTLFPNDIIRDSTGAITTIFDRYNNFSEVTAEGVDADVRWTLPAEWFPGKWTLKSNGSYLSSFRQPPATGAPITEFAGTNNGPRGALPRIKAKVGLDIDHRKVAYSFAVNHTSGYAQKRITAFPAAGVRRVNGQVTADFSIAYSGMKQFKLWANVQNIEDKQPPFDPGTFGWDSTQYDLRGRYIRAGLEYRFK